MTSLIIHGHFYQPPRENPWTGVIDPEPSAQPFHDWNERVYSECYQPNASVRIVNAALGEEQLVNNYAHISFDFGPTLLSWLARQHPETHAHIIAADAASVLQRQGHGNAIAHAYNHPILPLCNERDRRTQVRWGMADFRYRFGREPESTWLPETACNDEVLGLLIDEGLRFVILAPQQAARVRKCRTGIPACPSLSGGSSIPEGEGQTGKSVLPGDDWETVGRDTIDTSLAYTYLHRDGSGRSLAVFFYDQQLAHAIAFEQALTSSPALVERFARRQAARPGLISPGLINPGLINIATDGETYGHHHKFGELCLAYALAVDAPAGDFATTNYGEYLDQNPPVMEVEINNGDLGEGSSWSCVHGISRWIRDCGCHTGGKAGWNQAWRTPLRAALDFLRDEAASYFEATRGELFTDPWLARDDSISLILDEHRSREQFLQTHAPRTLTLDAGRKALGFLELQRNTQLMYASCAWFFNDISGIEPVQILKYACRAIELMNQLALPSARRQFLEILAEAKSNRPEMGTGADIFRRLVEPSNPSFKPEAEEVLTR